MDLRRGSEPLTHRWTARGREILDGSRSLPALMGIVNVTPDSFSDGGLAFDLPAAIARAEQLAAEGADLIDVGGESSRPGARSISETEELRRVVPVIEALVDRLSLPISVDTTKLTVAREAIRAGAAILNDIRALNHNVDLASLISDTGAGIVLMHMNGEPAAMQQSPRYGDVVAEVRQFLADRVDWAIAHGVARNAIAIDPGIGFGKTIEHNLSLLQNLPALADLDRPILIGVSRKRFLGELTGREVRDRLVPSVVAAVHAAARGAAVLRVHDVAATRDALTVWAALENDQHLSEPSERSASQP